MNAFDLSNAEPFEPEGPTPLVRETPPADRYPVEALAPLTDAALALHDVTQAPVAICAQSVLGVAALAAQPLGDAETLHDRAPTSLYLLTLAASGERKSTCDRLAMKAVRTFEAELREERCERLLDYRNKHDLWKRQREAALKKAENDPVTAQADLAALGSEPEPPLLEKIAMSEPTLEGITKNMGELRPSLGLLSDEGGLFIGGYGMSSENRLKTAAGLSKLWDGAPVDRVRAGDGVSVYPGRRLSAHLMVQPIAADALLSDRIAREQGLLARFLLTRPDATAGTRTRLDHSQRSEIVLSHFETRIAEMLRQPLPVREGTRNELEPPLVPLSTEARAVLEEFYIKTEIAQAEGGLLESVRPFASKAAEQAARIASVLALFAGDKHTSGETMANATTLATFYLGEAIRLADTALISPEIADAERMRNWMLRSWNEPFINASLAAGSGPWKETKRCRKALKTLEEYGWLVAVEGGTIIKERKRKEAWRIVRSVS